MTVVAERKSFISVGLLRAVYFVPSDHPAPDALKVRLDDALSKGLRDALAATASRLFSEADESVWLVRRLDVSLDVNAAWGREAIAASWASEAARALGRDLREDGDARNVIRFPTRAAYLASFLRDLSDSRAWGKWYYRSFEGLRALPQTAALRTAVCADADEGLAALRQLDRHERAQLVRALSRQDARRVLDALASDGTEGAEGAGLSALWAAWEESQLGASAGEEESHAALRLFLCASARGGVAHTAPGDLARALVRLASLVGEDADRARGALDALFEGDLSELFTTLGAADAEVLTPLGRCSVAHVREVFDALRARGTSEKRPARTEGEGPRHTPFGGLLMLLPALDELRLDDAAEGWPDFEETSAAAVLRMLVLSHCCGGTRSLRFFSDPLWRDLLAAGHKLTPRGVAEWQSGVGRARVERFEEFVAERQRSLMLVRSRRLALVRARSKGKGVCVLLDAERGVWLRVVSFDARKPAACVGRISHIISKLAEVSGEPPVILCDEVFAAALSSLVPGARSVVFGSAGAERLALEDPSVAESGARRARLGADLLYLTPPPAFGLRGRLRLALATAAQGLLRAFSVRMPGFALSGLEYLYANFLDCGASVEDETVRRVARIGRPPLNVVLSMTGAARGSHRLGWLDERPLQLFQEG
ncbi:MAG: hypothetical protein JOZ96_19940 [Acidobacteria bacterium]|nr:hypothetical protein [Acidobacteriota bacterium]